jgi:hypothetical protein
MPFRPGLPLGTRNAPTCTENSIPPTTRSVTASYSADLGMTKRVVASITFVNGATNQLQAANGTFPATTWAVGDTIMVEGANLNNGTFQVIGVDATNGAFLTVQGGVKAEGPVANVTVRAI